MNAASRAQPGAIFHGWWVVAALFLSGFMLFGGGLYTFILLIPVLTQEFHWSRAATGALVSTFWLAAPIALFGGILLKRFGPRRVLAAGVVIEALCVILFAGVTSLPVMYLLRALMGLGKVLFAVSIPVTIARWFSRRFGLGCAIAWAGWHAGGLVLAPIAAAIIKAYGWRTACVGLGITMIVVGLLPALWALSVDSPEQLGVGRDGAKIEPRAGDAISSDRAAPRMTSGDAAVYRIILTTPVFWLIAGAALFFWFVYSGTLTHQAALVQETGFSPQWSSLALGSTAALAAFGTILFGWITDRWNIVLVGLLEHGLLAVGVLALLLFARTPSLPWLVLHVICFGMAIGGGDVFWTTVLKRRLGEEIFGYTYGVWYFFVVVTLLIGPIVAGFLYDATGNYSLALVFLLMASLVAGVLALIVASGKSHVPHVSAS